jgi:hypothetical protein
VTGQPRYAADIRTGWHIRHDGDWRLVLAAHASQLTSTVTLVLRDGMHEESDLTVKRFDRLPTRTPEEQIQHIEAQRLAQPSQRGGGPVSRQYFRDRLFVRVAQILEGES